MLDVKYWSASKTIWWNVIITLIALVNEYMRRSHGLQIDAISVDDQHTILITLDMVVNMWLRFSTNQPISFLKTDGLK